MAMRDFKYSPGHKFGEMLRKTKAAAHGDRTIRGEAVPKTGLEGTGKPESGGSAGNRVGKSNHPSGTARADAHKVKGKVKEIRVEAGHGGHIVHVHYHGKKGKKGMPPPYMEPERHMHASKSSVKAHVGNLLDNMEPEEPMDSDDMARAI